MELSHTSLGQTPKTGGTSEDLPGGTQPTPSEQAIIKMVEAIVAETIFLYSIQVGQGNEELLSEESLNVLKGNLREWLASFIAAYGIDNLIQLFGKADFNETTAYEIGQMIVAAANGNMDFPSVGRFMNGFFSLSLEDVEASLPRGYNDDGEALDIK